MIWSQNSCFPVYVLHIKLLLLLLFFICVYVWLVSQNIPSSGIDKWFKLEGRSSKSHVDGDCHLKITLTTGKVTKSLYSWYCKYSSITADKDCFIMGWNIFQIRSPLVGYFKVKWNSCFPKKGRGLSQRLQICVVMVNNTLSPVNVDRQPSFSFWIFWLFVSWPCHMANHLMTCPSANLLILSL